MRHLRLISLHLVVFAAAICGRAQTPASATEPAPPDDDVIELATLEVTAHPSGAEERTAAVWVERPGASPGPTTVADLLAGVPGFHLDHAGGAGGRSTLYMRGGEENHTLVLLDSVPLNDPTNSRGGGVDFSLIDPAVIDSVAVVRGPASMRHGPEAISGVIHLDTAGRPEPGHWLAAEGGGDGLGRASFRSAFAVDSDATTANLGGSWHTEDATSNAGGLDRTFFHGGIQHAGTVTWAAHAWRLDQQSEAFPDDSGGVRFAIFRELEKRDDEQTGLSLRLGRSDEQGSWSLTADAARLEAETVSPGVAPGARDPAGLPASLDDIRLERYRAGLVIERHVQGWTVSGGLDAAREDGRDEAVLDFGPFQLPAGFSRTRDRLGAFLEGVGPLGRAVTLSTGVRADRFDDLGTHLTGRVGLLGDISQDLQWRANAGTGFKAPSFYSLAHPLVGNPDLKPERGRSLDAGLRHTFARGRGLLDFSVFANELRNGVDFDPGPPPRVANRAEIHARGAELAALWRATQAITFSSALTYTDARSQPEDTRMRSRPRWRGWIGASWSPLAPLAIEGRLTAVGGVPDSSIPTGEVMLPGWGRTDVLLRWQVNEHWSITCACDNVFDRTYEEVVGFVAPGRRVRFGMQARF